MVSNFQKKKKTSYIMIFNIAKCSFFYIDWFSPVSYPISPFFHLFYFPLCVSLSLMVGLSQGMDGTQNGFFRYLHEVCSPSVIHKNIKSANILLDAELNPHLSDSGLANFIPNADEVIFYRLDICTFIWNSHFSSSICWNIKCFQLIWLFTIIYSSS